MHYFLTNWKWRGFNEEHCVLVTHTRKELNLEDWSATSFHVTSQHKPLLVEGPKNCVVTSCSVHTTSFLVGTMTLISRQDWLRPILRAVHGHLVLIGLWA